MKRLQGFWVQHKRQLKIWTEHFLFSHLVLCSVLTADCIEASTLQSDVFDEAWKINYIVYINLKLICQKELQNIWLQVYIRCKKPRQTSSKWVILQESTASTENVFLQVFWLGERTNSCIFVWQPFWVRAMISCEHNWKQVDVIKSFWLQPSSELFRFFPPAEQNNVKRDDLFQHQSEKGSQYMHQGYILPVRLLPKEQRAPSDPIQELEQHNSPSLSCYFACGGASADTWNSCSWISEGMLKDSLYLLPPGWVKEPPCSWPIRYLVTWGAHKGTSCLLSEASEVAGCRAEASLFTHTAFVWGNFACLEPPLCLRIGVTQNTRRKWETQKNGWTFLWLGNDVRTAAQGISYSSGNLLWVIIEIFGLLGKLCREALVVRGRPTFSTASVSGIFAQEWTAGWKGLIILWRLVSTGALKRKKQNTKL